jgi:hypothetical protein
MVRAFISTLNYVTIMFYLFYLLNIVQGVPSQSAGKRGKCLQSPTGLAPTAQTTGTGASDSVKKNRKKRYCLVKRFYPHIYVCHHDLFRPLRYEYIIVVFFAPFTKC